ncbi:MAG: ribosome small subunit-dependent GTPase A, partial [Paramuribaculum sp.]|nr:ribosome small subunit-dependent GTPase A [Paramuribaculum sp.]
MKGLIIRNTGAHYMVLTDDGNETAAKVKGNFRIKGIRTTNPVAVGDRVEIRMPDRDRGDDTALIVAVEPRRNYIIRRSSNLSKEAHIIAANIDQAFLVVTLAHPTTSTTFIDRFLATAEAYGVKAFLVINKTDLLAGDPDGEALLEAVERLYRMIGYDVIALSALTGEGIDTLRERLAGKITLLSGNSGVGKSTIINDLLPGLNLRTAPISTVHDTGMHTT